MSTRQEMWSQTRGTHPLASLAALPLRSFFFLLRALLDRTEPLSLPVCELARLEPLRREDARGPLRDDDPPDAGGLDLLAAGAAFGLSRECWPSTAASPTTAPRRNGAAAGRGSSSELIAARSSHHSHVI